MDLNKLQELIRIFEASQLAEIEVEEEGRRVRLSKTPPENAAHRVVPVETVLQHHAFHSPPAAVQPSAPAPAAPEEPEPDDGLETIDSPMVGVFYVAPAPGEPPFVSEGDTVDKDATVCIVEAMKLMNEVTAKFPMEIVEVLVENGEPVEYNQPLFSARRLG